MDNFAPVRLFISKVISKIEAMAWDSTEQNTEHFIVWKTMGLYNTSPYSALFGVILVNFPI